MSVFVEGDVVVYDGELVFVEKFRRVALSNFGMDDYILCLILFVDGHYEWVNSLYLSAIQGAKARGKKLGYPKGRPRG